MTIAADPCHGVVTPTVTPPVTHRRDRMANLPKIVLGDPIARRWAALYDASAEGYRWDQGNVERRLVDAIGLLGRVGGAYGPKEFGGAWPAMADALDAYGRDETPEDSVRVTAAMVSEMEAALRWPAQYVQGRPQLRALQIWLRGKATGQSYVKGCRRNGIADSTGRLWRWQASLEIASGLMADGIAAPEEAEEPPADSWAGALQAAPAAPAPPPDAAGGATAPDVLWEAMADALARLRPYESPRQAVNALIIAQIKTEFAGSLMSKRVLRDMETRRRQLRVLARRRGFLDDGGPQ